MPTRLDDKQNGSIMVVMQRLHEDDLVGVLLRQSDEWTLLNLPAIAEHDENIPVGNGNYHYRCVGDVLHPEREPMAVLASLRAQLGAEVFAAQYQQRPVPPEGVMIKREWVRRYDELPRPSSRFCVQSWDVASKQGLQNDWSVCTTWLILEKRYYLADVLRGRFDYPTLKARVIAEAKHHGANAILIEDAGIGTALAQDLKQESLSIIPVRPDFDKQTRMFVQCSKIESGRVLLPAHAPWLADLELELFAFPRGKHDDQVDSISQALGYEATSSWPDASLKGYARLGNFLRDDAIFARLAGRPW
ncbi:phage terminase large subunit [Nitrobacter sp. NHB1]|uniref:phage terminase large subunit n=1 Tax=Nitrobacter sp. NHB1 TaxID=3119830 RepID=UPI00300093A7